MCITVGLLLHPEMLHQIKKVCGVWGLFLCNKVIYVLIKHVYIVNQVVWVVIRTQFCFIFFNVVNGVVCGVWRILWSHFYVLIKHVYIVNQVVWVVIRTQFFLFFECS